MIGISDEYLIIVFVMVVLLVSAAVVLSVLGGGENIIFSLGRKAAAAINQLLQGQPALGS